jgi:hypothetical protein
MFIFFYTLIYKLTVGGVMVTNGTKERISGYGWGGTAKKDDKQNALSLSHKQALIAIML